MPVQTPAWTEFLSCPICYKVFDGKNLCPISLACSHTICKTCLSKLQQKKCPFDQNLINRSIAELPINYALLQLVGVAIPNSDGNVSVPTESINNYESARHCIEALALYLKPLSTSAVPGQVTSNGPTQVIGVTGSSVSSTTCPLSNCALSRPMQRKLVTLVNCQLVEEEGRGRAMRAARSLGERTVTELILQHQNPQQLSSNLWAAVRARGCQFLGPAMQEEVLKLILLALEDGSALSRKVLVMFVVQRLETHYPQASKTAIGHVVQLLYRASCFVVTKREEESSLMQLKEECRTYDALRRDHDSQIVQIAMEAGLRIAPDQWSSLLYGDTTHKSHMQSIIDKLQTPQSFSQSVNELVIALQRTGDPCNLQRLRAHLEFLANIDPSPEAPPPSWENLEAVMKAVRSVVQGLVDFVKNNGHKKLENTTVHNSRYKTSMCRDFLQKNTCPRAANCTFAHSQEELEKYRSRTKKGGKICITPPEYEDFSPCDDLQQRSTVNHQERPNLESFNSASQFDNQRTPHNVVTAKVLTSVAKSLSSLTFAQAKGLTADKMTESSETGPRMSSVVIPGITPLLPPPNTMQPPPVQMPHNPYPVDLYQGQIPQRPSGIPPPAPSRPVFGGGGSVLNPGRPGFPSVPRFVAGPYRQPYNQALPPAQYPASVSFRQPVDQGLTRIPFPQQQQQQPPMNFVNCNYQQNSSTVLNPYAEPFQGGGSRPLTPEDQMYPVLAGGYPEGYNYQLGSHGQGQDKILNDLHHRRAEILNRLFNPMEDQANTEVSMYSTPTVSQSDTDDKLRGAIHPNKVFSNQTPSNSHHQGLPTHVSHASNDTRQDILKMMIGQRSRTGKISDSGQEDSPATRQNVLLGSKKQVSNWSNDFNNHQQSSTQVVSQDLEEFKFTSNKNNIGSCQAKGISSYSEWGKTNRPGANYFRDGNADMSCSQAYSNHEHAVNITNSTNKAKLHSKSDTSHWRTSHNSVRNRTFATRNGHNMDVFDASKLQPDNVLTNQQSYMGQASRNTSTISNPSDTPAALDTGCAVWSIDGIDDVVWNFTDTQAMSNKSNEEEDLLKEEEINSTEFMLNWLHDIPDEPTPIEPMDQFILPLRSLALDRTEDDAIIPFDSKPIVSRFGPISRSARTKYKNTEPVQVTANDIMKVTPVTAVTPLDHPKPTAKAQPSYVAPVVETSSSPNAVRWRRPSELENCVQRELNRLEQQALKADTENEFLACELKAVELQISLQTEKTGSQSVSETPILKPEIHPAVEVVVPVPIAVPVKADTPHNPPGIWSSFDLLKAAYTRGQKMDELRELFKQVPVDQPTGTLTPQEEQFLKEVLGVESPGNFKA
ncbi:uncharacterized protein [Argopecten irradians]|uniref:uncharacterized protein n=1 Tax=Argopecten irradians TaxID=31199 RepID=UPI0037126CCF